MHYRPAQLIEHFVGGVLDIVEPKYLEDDSELVDRHHAVFN
jgi:hypothetical protein